MSENFCATCTMFKWPDHVCPPVWRVRQLDDRPSDGDRFYAFDAEHAANKWAEETDHEGSLEPEDVIVTGEDGVDCRFSVSGEITVRWSVTEVENGAS